MVHIATTILNNKNSAGEITILDINDIFKSTENEPHDLQRVSWSYIPSLNCYSHFFFLVVSLTFNS